MTRGSGERGGRGYVSQAPRWGGSEIRNTLTAFASFAIASHTRSIHTRFPIGSPGFWDSRVSSKLSIIHHGKYEMAALVMATVHCRSTCQPYDRRIKLKREHRLGLDSHVAEAVAARIRPIRWGRSFISRSPFLAAEATRWEAQPKVNRL